MSSLGLHNLNLMQIFEPQNKNGKSSKKNPEVHSYLLEPVTGNARYIKLPSNESRKSGQPLQKAIVYLDDVTLCLSKVYSLLFICLFIV